MVVVGMVVLDMVVVGILRGISSRVEVNLLWAVNKTSLGSSLPGNVSPS